MKAVVFSGTSDGKEITEYLSKKGIITTVCTATKYGGEIMGEMPFVTVHSERLDVEGMCGIMENADIVIDATHPYAFEVTQNIKKACDIMEVRYVRLIRDETAADGVIYAENIDAAVDMLKNEKGNIFVSTGSKEIEKYTAIEDYKNRIAARVLPVENSVRKCREIGIKNIISKKGPFSYAENIKDMKKYDSRILVTKSSGTAGGFCEKINAAKHLGIKIIVISRPSETEGYGINEVKKIIDSITPLKFPLFVDMQNKNVLVVGCGNVAKRRIETLKNFGACIKVVSEKTHNIKGVKIIQKSFDENDITDDLFMVIAATDKREVNHKIYEICKEKNIFLSVADCKEECSFYFPAVCLSENISVGIVSEGNNHTLVKEKAKEIRRLIGNENTDRQQRK